MKYLFEYVDHTLETDIQIRKKNKLEHYNEGELWLIIAHVLSALVYLLSQDSEHGDIQPCNIFITNDG